MLTFSNPRLRAEFTDWPLGGSKRGKCVFHTERKDKKGDRVGRTTTGKTKYSTYGGPVSLVDGSNGRTYILQKSPPIYGHSIGVSRSDFMNANEQDDGIPHYIPETHERYTELLALIIEANQKEQPVGA